MEKLDLSSLENWSPEVVKKARDLLYEYHDIFSVEKNELGHKAALHKIVLKDPKSVHFRDRFRCILPPQVEEVRDINCQVPASKHIHQSESLCWSHRVLQAVYQGFRSNSCSLV